jgi:two-component system, sensor histidine kinase PdtaS
MRRYIIIAGSILFLQLYTVAQSSNDKATGELLANLQKSKPDSNRLSLLNQLGTFYFFHYDNNESYVDSAIYFFQQELQLGKKLNFNGRYGINESILMIGQSYLYASRRPDEARKYFMYLINAYHLSGEKSKEANVWTKWAHYMPFRAFLTDQLYNLKQAATLYHEDGDKQMEIYTSIAIANVYLQNEKSVIAENLLLNILDSNAVIKPDNLFNTYYLLSVINRYKGDFNKALSYSLKNLTLTNETKSVGQESIIDGELGLIYQELGQHDKSIEYYIKTIELKGNSTQFQIALFKTADLIVEQFIIQGKAKKAIHFIDSIAQKHPPLTAREKASLAQTLGKCYDASGQYKPAEKYYLEMINYYDHAPLEKEYGILAQIVIGKFYLERQQYKKAGYYLDKALSASSEIAISKVKDIHLMLYKVDSAQGNYLSAIDHLRQHQVLNDSIFNEKKSKQIEELQIQYETEKKDQLIGLSERNIQLLTKQGELQKGKLQQATMLKNITFAGIVLLIIIVLLLFNRYRLKQRTNNKLELQQKLINQKNTSLQNLVDEKEWLLKEVHHRVKNNLQMVISLLNSQSVYLDNTVALNAINDSRHRVHAMSLIHQKLYNSENVSTINIAAYIGELVEYMRSCFDLGQRVSFVLDIAPLDLDVSQAIPVGLILNEAITNSIKYAFPEGRNGIIKITLLHISGKLYELTIADDGIGMPENFDEQRAGSLGMNLMNGLSEDLDGNFTIENNKGTVIRISFVYDEIAHHSSTLLSPEQDRGILELE